MGDLVHLRLEKEMKDRISSVVKIGLFSNMTEFIRDSIRKNIDYFEKKRAIHGLAMLRGNAHLLSKSEQANVRNQLKKLNSSSDLFRKLGLD